MWGGLLEEYADNYKTLREEQADALVTQAIKIHQQTLNLQKKYYAKIKKALSARQAAGWLQLENFIESSVRIELSKRVPFVGQE